MDKSISFYDAGAEGFYHGLVLGLIPREDRYPGIIMELKWNKDLEQVLPE